MAFHGPILQVALKFHLDSTRTSFKIALDWLLPKLARGIFLVLEVEPGFWFLA